MSWWRARAPGAEQVVNWANHHAADGRVASGMHCRGGNHRPEPSLERTEPAVLGRLVLNELVANTDAG